MNALDRFIRYRPAETAERQKRTTKAVETGISASASSGRLVAEQNRLCQPLPPPADNLNVENSGQVITFCHSAASAISDEETERLAVIEHDGRIPEVWAAAYQQLCACRRPEWLSPTQWQVHIDVAGVLVARWSAAMDRFGWPASEVLGVNPKSEGGWDQRCLLPALVGVRVAALEKHSITIVYGDGGRRQLGRNAGNWVYL